MLRLTCVFAFSGVYGTRSPFRYIRGAKCDRTILHAWVGPGQIRQKA
jgi:hypothetical protein